MNANMKYNNVLRSKYDMQYVQVLSKEANIVSCNTVNKWYYRNARLVSAVQRQPTIARVSKSELCELF